MSETSTPSTEKQPPPAPPLPPARLGPLHRFIAPLGFSKASGRENTTVSQPSHPGPPTTSCRSYGSLPSQTGAHRTGIPIAALDINQQKTHAILAGKEILRTVRVHNSKVTEEFNLRNSITSYESTHGSTQGGSAASRREYLPARDVKWSVGKFDHIIATAAANGRIAVYDVNAAGSRIELARLHEHTGQVNKLDFDPFGGYWLLSASQDKTVKLWDMRDPKTTRSKQRFEIRSGVRDVRWSPKEGNDFDFAVCADGGIIQHWDARNPLGPKLSINAHERGCYSLDWHPDGRHVVSGGFDKYIRVWDFKSDSRRQKPTFQFRAAQAIRRIRWRPPAGVIETTEGKLKQTTQIATTYHHDDPRIHLWDFRRPLLPFREIDTYNTPANDFLWASQDLLWTVGDQGMFTQNDVKFAPQVRHTLPPCALEWSPDGQCTMFAEERSARRASDPLDPTSSFLNIPRDRLSGEEGDFAAPFDVDPDEMENESFLTTSLGRRTGRVLSSQSANFQANSPSFPETPIQNLDKTVLASKDLLHNSQTGMIGYVEGASVEPEVVEFLANYYSSPATETERKASPTLILQRLEACFNNNADVCDEASLHRMAQSWRILSAVIIPELRDWANENRSTRRAEAAQRRLKDNSATDSKTGLLSSPFAKIPSNDLPMNSDRKGTRVISNLFRGLKEPNKGNGGGDQATSSNMTTPLARPLMYSPGRATHTHGPSPSEDVRGGIDNFEALPPSLLNSHSTASAAARALMDTTGDSSDAGPPSPEQPRRSPAQPSRQEHPVEVIDPASPSMQSPAHPVSGDLAIRLRRAQTQRQEEQRAALRDYRAQSRPIFTLDAPAKSLKYGATGLRDSAESFSMFPASSSSHGENKIDQSYLAHDRKTWLSREHSENSELILGLDTATDSSDSLQKTPNEQDGSFSPFYRSDDFSTGLDGSSESKDAYSLALECQKQAKISEPRSLRSIPQQSMISSSPEMFQFDHSISPPRTRIHSINPVSKASMYVPGKVSKSISFLQAENDLDMLESEDYLFSDFRPIDLSKYHPRLPFAWSSLPLICQMVAFDMENGIAAAQFAAHVLLHVSPYFFSKDFRDTPVQLKSWPESVAERLMIPGLSHRIIESLLLKYITFLRTMALYESLAEIRKLCVDLEYDRVFEASLAPKEASPGDGDTYVVASICSHCQSPWERSQDVCARCLKGRPPCPICLATRSRNDVSATPSDPAMLFAPQLWMYCQACGHSAHTSCMQEWLSQPFADGVCATPGCGCDCSPGRARQSRVEQQLKAEEESKLIRGNSGPGSTKKDPVHVSQSPAVDKARAVLRAAGADRGTQSSDERSMPTRKPGRQSVGASGLGSSRKSVRLVTPGEERRPLN